MCGIVSVFSPERPVDEAALGRAMDALGHRGPDGEGRWISPDRRVALGHRRLAILDLEGGAQPIAGDGDLHLVANGEFYGFEALRAGLERRGHRFRTRTDSEIALPLYRERGLKALESLRGEFAFAIWDGGARTLFAARDRFGIKPLCYAVHDGALWMASEAKALFAAGIPARWDADSFALAAALQYAPPDRTLFAGVRQVPPGHVLTADASGHRLRRYWDLDAPLAVRRAGEGDEAALVAELRDRLDEAVRIRLRADVPVCFHLSGGLDSGAVLGLAAPHLRNPEAFTVAFDHAPYDELEIARETARYVGARLVEVRVTQSDLIRHLPEAVWRGEGLAVNGHLSAKFLLSRAIRAAGYKVALTGEGSDEVFAGYAHLREDLLRAESRVDEIDALRARNAVSAGLMLASGEGGGLEAVQERLGFVPSFLRAKAELGARLRPLLSAPALPDGPRRFLESFGDPSQLEGRHRVDQSVYLWCKSALATYILRTLGDGMETAHSVEGRLPFLDHPLFEFSRRLPPSLKIRGEIEKHALREAVRDRIPDAVYQRRKHPFLAPPVSLFADAEGQALVRDLVAGKSFASMPFFDHGRVAQFLDRLPSLPVAERTASDPVVMMVLTAGLIHERFHL